MYKIHLCRKLPGLTLFTPKTQPMPFSEHNSKETPTLPLPELHLAPHFEFVLAGILFPWLNRWLQVTDTQAAWQEVHHTITRYKKNPLPAHLVRSTRLRCRPAFLWLFPPRLFFSQIFRRRPSLWLNFPRSF